MLVDNLFSLIDKGREGHNWGLPMGMPKLEMFVDGVARDTKTIVFSGSGVGKTSFVLHSYMYKPLTYCIDNPDLFEVHYFSLEMKAEILLAKLLSTHIKETYGVNIPYKEMMSKQRNRILSDEKYELIKKSREWLNRIDSMIHIHDKSLNAKTYFDTLKSIADNNGKFIETESRKIYTPNNENKTILIVIDHIAFNRWYRRL